MISALFHFYTERQERLSKRSKKLLDDALQKGYIDTEIIVLIVVGQPGVGKSHTKYLILDRRPPHLRNSTSCAETPVRIEVRSVSGSRIQNLRGRWKEVNNEEMLDIIAKMILLAEPEVSPESDGSFFSKVAKFFQLDSQNIAGAKMPKLKPISMSKAPKKVKGGSSAPLLSNTCQKAVKEIMEKLLDRISKMCSSKGEEEGSAESLSDLIKSKWVYFTDSGGQPEYHELLPLFVRGISAALCVTRLTDRLDEIQKVDYYQEGEQVGASQQSQLSAKDTIQCLVNTIQSCSDQEKPPNVMVIGTHLDKLEEAIEQGGCSGQQAAGNSVETIEEKNKMLLDMLTPEFADQLIYSSSDMKQLIFPLNAFSPGDRDKAIAQQIRTHVEKSVAKNVRIPIWWHILHLLLEELARVLGRGVLSRAECLAMARQLSIKEDSFDAALEFFNDLNVIKYMPDVLPGVIFIDSQIPLDKLSELVFHNYLLRQPASAKLSFSVEGEWLSFRDRGLVSKECLKKFPKHYVPNVFAVDHLCEVLKKQLVFAPVLKHRKKASKKEASTKVETHFVMPALLLTISEDELGRYRVSSPGLATLLVRFPYGSRRSGVFCCFVVHLIDHFGWSPLLDDSVALYRNCYTVHLPTDPPCTVTLIDSNSLIEVSVKLPSDVSPSECSSLLNVIKNAILSGIDAACIALNYEKTNPEFTFRCPHTQPTSESSPSAQACKLKPHTATLNDKKTYLCCDVVRGNTYRLQSEHLVWFEISQGIYTVNVLITL